MSPCSMPFSSDITHSNPVWLPDDNNETYCAVPSHVPVLYKCVQYYNISQKLYDAVIVAILNMKDCVLN